MSTKLFVFRHAETTDNKNNVFSGWRNPKLTPKGYEQAHEIEEQLKKEKIDYAFTSHLVRAKDTLNIVLESHPDVPIFVDDRLIERCYGLLQGKSKTKVAEARPEWFAKVHRGYDFQPPEGESLKMVEKRTIPFLTQLREWLKQNKGNAAISCHGNSLRTIRRVFENLSVKQMLKLENPQNRAMSYALNIHNIKIECKECSTHSDWKGILLPTQVMLASDQRNSLKKYY
jgi:2,3-bisphosphoglycerate-dependent phosphoglycerate mutase